MKRSLEHTLFEAYRKKIRKLSEVATSGATSSASISTVANPHVAIGKKPVSFTGSPGKSRTKSPKPPKVVQPKNPDGTVKNAADLSHNIFGAPVRR